MWYRNLYRVTAVLVLCVLCVGCGRKTQQQGTAPGAAKAKREPAKPTLPTKKPPAEPVKKTPAVPVKKSVTSDAIVCLECGKQQKMLKRHLFTAHGTTPDEYRAKWQLGYDYPMIAPAYAEMRQAIAKKIGLGRKPGKTAKPAAKRTRKKA